MSQTDISKKRVFSQKQVSDGYIFHKKKSEGAYGKTYKLTDKESSNKYYAVKTFTSEEPNCIPGDVLREITILSNLSHPNIIALSDVYFNSSFHMLMPWAGYSLHKIWTKYDTTRFDMELIKSWCYQILSAAAYLHTNGVIHADLKPENIMIGKDMSVCIIDFGLSQYIGVETIDIDYSLNVQTIWYRSPEVLYKKPYGYPIDIWSIGVIIMMLLDGSYMFAVMTDDELKMKYSMFFKDGEPTIPKKVLAKSRKANDLISLMLKENPLNRITAKAALLHPLFTSTSSATPASESSGSSGFTDLDNLYATEPTLPEIHLTCDDWYNRIINATMGYDINLLFQCLYLLSHVQVSELMVHSALSLCGCSIDSKTKAEEIYILEKIRFKFNVPLTSMFVKYHIGIYLNITYTNTFTKPENGDDRYAIYDTAKLLLMASMFNGLHRYKMSYIATAIMYKIEDIYGIRGFDARYARSSILCVIHDLMYNFNELRFSNTVFGKLCNDINHKSLTRLIAGS
jgi:serine/threonine protein kinase